MAGFIVYLGERSKRNNPTSYRKPLTQDSFYIPPIKNRPGSKNDTVIDAEYPGH